MRIFSSILLLLSLLFTSCSKEQDNVVIYKEFPNQEWERFEYLTGDFSVNKSAQKYDVVIEVTVNDNYPNVYEAHQSDCPLLFNLTIKNPDGVGQRSRDYKFMLKDQDGNWKADNKNGHYVFKLPIMSEISLGEKGVYNFRIENKYPKDPLQGIKSVTLKCINSK
jgi:gliding motility-associated lipoprotein GldH